MEGYVRLLPHQTQSWIVHVASWPNVDVAGVAVVAVADEGGLDVLAYDDATCPFAGIVGCARGIGRGVGVGFDGIRDSSWKGDLGWKIAPQKRQQLVRQQPLLRDHC